MNQKTRERSHVGTFVIGMLLLVLGVLLLLSRAGVVQLNLTRIGSFIILLVGGFEAISAFAASAPRKLFWGSVVFLVGLLLILVSYRFIPDSWNRIWPSALIIPGLAFLMLFFSNPKEFALLIIAVLFVAIGWAGLFAVRGDAPFSDSIMESLHIAIPVAVVAAGFYVIWKTFFRSHA